MNSVRLSIIVPVYNVEPYVERCLRSLLENQELSSTEYEVIVTNDGSPDNSRAIVENLQSEFPNLILINQENQGVSMARNNAIAIAKGRYILPIDPDDYIVPHALRPALKQAEVNDLDVLYCAFEIFDRSDHSIWRTDYSALESQIDNGYDGYFAVRGPKIKDPDRSWAMFYKVDLLRKHRIQYPKDVPMLEDGLFLGKVFSVAQRVGYSDKDFYQRTTRPGSATDSKNWSRYKTIDGYIKGAKDLSQFKIENTLSSKGTILLNRALIKYCSLGLITSIVSRDISKYLYARRKLKSYGLKRLDLRAIPLDAPAYQLGKAYNSVEPISFIQYTFLSLKSSKWEKKS